MSIAVLTPVRANSNKPYPRSVSSPQLDKLQVPEAQV